MAGPPSVLSKAKTLAQQRSKGSVSIARALWHIKPGVSELRTERLGAPPQGTVRIETQYSGISRGTERLVASGQVPDSEWQRMRAPMQAGDFPFPVKYGYSAAGIVTGGEPLWLGKRVFVLHPHQDIFDAPASALIAIPPDIPAKRATLAANMETALNAHWDARTAPGDRVLVIGAGVVGLLIAYLAKRMPGTRVGLVDTDPEKAKLANTLGLVCETSTGERDDFEIVFHTTATATGLETALAACAFEGRIIELSWYGGQDVPVRLGGAFHSRRLTILSSQVGHVAPAKRSTTTHRERLTLALQLLDDPALDCLVANEVSFAGLPAGLGDILQSRQGVPPVVRYGAP